MAILFYEKEKMFDRGESRIRHRRSPDEKLEWYRIIGESIRSGFAEFIIATRFAYPRLDDVYAAWDQFAAGIANDMKTAGGLFEVYCYSMAKRNFIRTEWLNTEFMPKYRKSVGENLGLNDLYETQFELFSDLSRTCNAAGPERIIDSLNKFNARFQRTEQGFVPTPTTTVERMLGMLEDSITQNTIVVDPCCGRGIFLLMLTRRYPEHRIYGIEKDVGKAYLAAAFVEPHSNSRIVSNVLIRDFLTIKNFDKEIFNMPDSTMALSDAAERVEPSRIVFVGNPPYQEIDTGNSIGGSASPLYNRFIETAQIHGDSVLFIIPAKWYSSGKGLDGFRRKMLTEGKIREIVDYPNTSDVFNVNITGGICMIHLDKKHTGRARFTQNCSVLGDSISISIDLSKYDILVRDLKAPSIIDKLKVRHNVFMDSTVSSRKPFGLGTNYSNFRDNGYPCMTRNGLKYVSKTSITAGWEMIDKWKTYCSRASGGDAQNTFNQNGQKGVLGVTGVLAPGSVCLETYLIAAIFDKEVAARNCAAYLLTKFARFLLGLRKIDQNIAKERFMWVPYMDFTRSWTDQQLYDHFDLTPDERAYIEATIR